MVNGEFCFANESLMINRQCTALKFTIDLRSKIEH